MSKDKKNKVEQLEPVDLFERTKLEDTQVLNDVELDDIKKLEELKKELENTFDPRTRIEIKREIKELERKLRRNR
ncbi:hypothetical protein [Mycoplasmoides pneumoniae]|uniref:Uncharacterized protein n=3 Tax=Mycoplasmoides pneumoniae TaxID=2104 RepID=A0AAX0SQJ9_MYCPM|nr:hypothetical protein [Mycoplasmoides pneumoniae]ADK87075.1 conserved hypothetical protein [Mycoplasmoides pneumoniae FH]ALA31205.1 hypothetical protein B434_03645 [Mycoplasmoides pneumoniae 19294]ALA31652.1 hypothetical protein F536_02120 [Mycoplasmoides pneumoniae 39443]ALA35881.1 hypothetical protein F539_02120 [Mycoplasmoides pneumoniae FH]ALA36590.1 hypothetical protein F538_02135 [Mycoplasmoides pneumoniae M1139]